MRGDGLAIVRATGPRSEIGQIGQALGKIATEPPRLQQQTRPLVRIFAAVGMAASLLAVLLYGLLRGDWLQAVLGGIALGMSMLPEEFPLVLTAFMVMGAWRLSQARVSDAPCRRHRDAGIGDGPVHRQDGHADREPHDDWPTLRLVAGRIRCSRRDLIEAALLASGRDSFDPMERAIAAQAALQPGGAKASMPAWSWSGSTGCDPSFSP